MLKYFLLSFVLLLTSETSWSKGQLLLIGGGERTRDILLKMIELSRGSILIVPDASDKPEVTAASAKAQLESHGAREVQIFHCIEKNVDRESCLNQVSTAGLIYFTGGSQNKLLSALKNTKAFEIIKARFQNDLSLAGTSAGTAVMSEVMITGRVLAPFKEFDGINAKMVETTTGFGFLKKIIVDQHFLKRSRQNRLISAVFDRKSLIGVGIDEATAILVRGDESFEVLGKSSVMVIDARDAKIRVGSEGNYSATNPKISILTSGMKFKP